MNQLCKLAGCNGVVRSRYSPLCQSHRQRLRRFGDPRQATPYPRDFKRHLSLIEQRQKANPDNRAWAILRARWTQMVDLAIGQLRAIQAGEPFHTLHLETATALQGIAGAADADLVVRTVMAVVFLRLSNPRAFVSDRAETFVLARMALRLDPSSTGRYWDPKTKKSKTVRRDFSPRFLEHLGEQLREAFAGAAGQLFALEERRALGPERERQELASALQALKV
jgi:hypothetical protein